MDSSSLPISESGVVCKKLQENVERLLNQSKPPLSPRSIFTSSSINQMSGSILVDSCEESFSEGCNINNSSFNYSFSHRETTNTQCSVSLLLTSPNGSIITVDDMNEEQLKTSLNRSLTENSMLIAQLDEKNKRIDKLKDQFRALLSLEDGENKNDSSVMDLSCLKFQEASSDENEFDTGSNEDVQSRNSNDALAIEEISIDNRLSTVILRTLTEQVWVDRVTQIQTMEAGSHVSKRVIFGSAIGWLSAILIKKFGKFVIISIGGGLVILKYASQRGYVLVNWSEIYNELRETAEAQEEEHDWISEHVKKSVDFVKSHTYAAVGFLGGFIYKLLT